MTEAPSKLPDPGSDDVLWLIDLSNYVFRAYHALPPLTNSRGEPTNATLGTLNMLNRMIEDHRPRYLAVVMDSPGRGFRAQIDPEYKANRSKAPPDLQQQIVRTREIFEAYGVPIFKQDGLEADDLIATLTKKAVAAGLRVVVASTDKDLLQLVEKKRVFCWDAMRNKVYGPPEVVKKFGVPPEKVRHVLALIGDTSDNVPGVPGVGPKTAAKLIDRFGDIEGVFSHLDEIPQPKLNQNLTEHQDAARRAFELVGLRLDAEAELDLKALVYGQNRDTDKLRELFTELQFTRFLDMLDDAPASVPPEAEQRPVEYRVIVAREDLEGLAASIRKSGRVAIAALGPEEDPMRTPLTGLALSPEPFVAAYVPLGHRYLTAPKQLTLEVVREVLGPVLADGGIAKLGHDLKHSAVILAHHGLEVLGTASDSLIQSYLLDPEGTHKLGLIAEREVRMSWTDFESLVPKPKKGPRHTIEELEVEVVGPFACAHADAASRLTERFDARLEKYELLELYRDLEIPLLDVLTTMERRGCWWIQGRSSDLGWRWRGSWSAWRRRRSRRRGTTSTWVAPNSWKRCCSTSSG
ncbi:MAG: 5'-3' exonuclease H3TH domain-containing protein [Polyangiaceae bacterium]